MDQIEQSQGEFIHDYKHRQNTEINSEIYIESNCLAKECVTSFEELSNELMYEIFEFFESHHAFQTFYDLNQRFRNLFIHSNLPIKINISSIAKSAFQRYLSHIIIPHANRIKSLRFSNPFATDMCLLVFPVVRNLTQLEALTLNNIDYGYMKEITDDLSCLPILSSLTITTIDNIKNQNDLYYKIFRLRALKYCQLKVSGNIEMLSAGANEFSPVEHLVINDTISINQMDSLLSYFPQLRHLSIADLDGHKKSRTQKSPLILNYLTNVSLKLRCVIFHELESLIVDFFRQVQVLRIIAHCVGSDDFISEYLNADRWEQLISTSISNLDVFDFQYRYYILSYNGQYQASETEINKFNSSFWVKHQWFFEYQYCPRSNTAILYSRNPYRRKNYMLCEVQTKNMWLPGDAINEDSIHHLYISSSEMTKQFSIYFPNITELTLVGAFDVCRNSFAISLARFIPLKHLTKLNLRCNRFRFEQLVELLQSTENIHTLTLHSIFFYRTDSVSIQQSEIFRIVSKTNTITNVTISEKITLGDIQLLTSVFPRMEYLTINLHKEVLEPITRFLLSKSNNSTCYLFSLCFSDQWMDLTKELKTFIESEQLLHDFKIKLIDQKLYLWW